MKNRTLHRNFMGYTPKSNVDLFGLGVSAISEFDTYFTQNEKDLALYGSQIGTSGFAVTRGIALSEDDQIRKWVILRLICHFFVSFSEFHQQFNLEFKDYFAEELITLKALESDGLIEMGNDHITVVNHGQILVRNICMVFDQYISKKEDNVTYSKTI